MKKFVNKFFGIKDLKNCGQNYGHGYSFTPYLRQTCGWNILCSFVSWVIDACTILVIVLLALKMNGMAKQSWTIVFLPILLRSIWISLRTIVDQWIKNTNKRIQEEAYEEWWRNYKMETTEEIEKEEDEFEDGEEDLYDLK